MPSLRVGRRIQIVVGLFLLTLGGAVHADTDWAAIAEWVKANNGSLRILVDSDVASRETKSLDDRARELIAYMANRGIKVDTVMLEDKDTGRALKTVSAASLKAEEPVKTDEPEPAPSTPDEAAPQ